jgi:hypothetical protein
MIEELESWVMSAEENQKRTWFVERFSDGSIRVLLGLLEEGDPEAQYFEVKNESSMKDAIHEVLSLAP